MRLVAGLQKYQSSQIALLHLLHYNKADMWKMCFIQHS